MLCDDFLEVKHNLGFIGGILTVDLCSFNEILFFSWMFGERENLNHNHKEVNMSVLYTFVFRNLKLCNRTSD